MDRVDDPEEVAADLRRVYSFVVGVAVSRPAGLDGISGGGGPHGGVCRGRGPARGAEPWGLGPGDGGPPPPPPGAATASRPSWAFAGAIGSSWPRLPRRADPTVGVGRKVPAAPAFDRTLVRTLAHRGTEAGRTAPNLTRAPSAPAGLSVGCECGFRVVFRAILWSRRAYKVNFHHGLHFVNTKNFKPAGEPRWETVSELPED